LLQTPPAAVQDRRTTGPDDRDRQAIGAKNDPDRPRVVDHVSVGLGGNRPCAMEGELPAMYLAGADDARGVDPQRGNPLQALLRGTEVAGRKGGRGAGQARLEPALSVCLTPLHRAPLPPRVP